MNRMVWSHHSLPCMFHSIDRPVHQIHQWSWSAHTTMCSHRTRNILASFGLTWRRWSKNALWWTPLKTRAYQMSNAASRSAARLLGDIITSTTLGRKYMMSHSPWKVLLSDTSSLVCLMPLKSCWFCHWNVVYLENCLVYRSFSEKSSFPFFFLYLVYFLFWIVIIAKWENYTVKNCTVNNWNINNWKLYC